VRACVRALMRVRASHTHNIGVAIGKECGGVYLAS